MKKICGAFVVAMLAMTLPGFAQSEARLNMQAARGGRAIPDNYIVVLKAGADPSAVAQRHGAAPKHVYSRVLKGFAAELSRGQLQRVLRDPDVAYVDEDGLAQVVGADPLSDPKNLAGNDVTPTVIQPTPGGLWGLDKLDQEWGGGLNGAYNYVDRGLGVNVYVVDTGIRTTHTQFDGAALNRAKAGALGFDAFGGNGQDCHGHGTHVAGTIGGTTYGVAKAVKLYAVRVLDCGGFGAWSGVIAGIEWVTNNHAKPAVANASLGGGYVQAVNDAVTESVLWGVTWVVAAGNDNINACNASPAATPLAITVAATDSGNNKAGFSNWGPCVDINAPGVGVLSSWIGSDVATNTISGTSMASPHVAGLAALYYNANKTAAPGEVEEALEDSGVNGVVNGLGGGTPNLLAHKINGNLSGTGAQLQEPDVFNGQWYYFANNPGYHHVKLRGTPGTNYNIEFYRWNGAAWIKVAQKTTGSTNESLKYFGQGGFFYMYLVKSANGAGTYDSWVIRPD